MTQTILGRLNAATAEDWDNANKVTGLCPPQEAKPHPDSKQEIHPSMTQVGGEHYLHDHQPLQMVLDMEGYEAFRGACLTKVYKYLGRKKTSRTEDYRKAQHVLDWLVREEEKQT